MISTLHANYGSDQHYLPRFLLRPFGHGKKRRRLVWWFNKATMTVGKSEVDEVACEPGYYDSVAYGQGEFGADGVLERYENIAAPAFRKLIDRHDIRCLTEEDRDAIVRYIFVHLTRTPNARNDIAQIWNLLAGGDIAPHLVQEFFAGYVKQGPHLHNDILEAKRWVLIEECDCKPFWIADTWINLANPREQFRSRNGIANSGISVCGTELQLPLAPDLCLLLACPTSNWYRCHEDGTLIWNNPNEWVKPMRIRQLCSAHSVIYAASSDFSMAVDFLTKNPQYGNPPQNLVYEWLKCKA